MNLLNSYFDCVDFEGEGGTKYDIDVFLKWNGHQFAKIQRKEVHKVNGKPRYLWFQEEGKWVTKPVNEKTKSQHHPDHPGH